MESLLIFFIGLIFGSFLNVLVDRGQKGESLLGFSKCDFCGYKLRWFDNIPVLSFLFLRGCCRKCKKKLSWQYPLVELGMAVAFLMVVWRKSYLLAEGFGFSGIFGISFYLMVIFLFLAIFLWDIKYMIIPNELVLGGFLLTFFYYSYLQLFSLQAPFFSSDNVLFSGLIGGLLISGFFYLMFFFSKGRWIGGGDVKLGFWLGFLVGWKLIYPMLLLTYVSGALVAVALLVFRKKKMNSQVPFGPFLVASAFLILLFGEGIIKWYWSLLIF